MNRSNSGELDPDIASLLGGTELYPAAPEDVQLRVREKLVLRLAATASVPRSVESRRDLGEDTVRVPRRAPWWTARPGPILLTTFLLGGAAGATLHAAVGTPRDRVIFVTKGSSANDAPAVPSARPTGRGSAEGPVLPSAASTASSGAPSIDVRAASSDLGAEQALLDAARTALAQGHAADALSPLEAHARRFPRGLLAEEREALSVNALVTVGRNDEARRRGTRFLQRYPSSLLRPTVEAAIGAASVTD